MEILQEWFAVGESDLYLLGYALIFAMIAMPAKKEKYGADFALMGIGFLVYVLCEFIMTVIVPASYSTEFLLLFIGGTAFSVSVGRMIKFYLIWMGRGIKKILDSRKQKKDSRLEEVDEEIVEEGTDAGQ